MGSGETCGGDVCLTNAYLPEVPTNTVSLQGRFYQCWEPAHPLPCVRSPLHARRQTPRLFGGCADPSPQNVRRRPQLPAYRALARRASSNRHQLGQCRCRACPSHATRSCTRGNGRDGRAVYLCADEKKELYVVTLLDRVTHCYVGWAVLEHRTEAGLQALVDAAPQATAYYSDGFATYANLVYGAASDTAILDKSQTYTVEGGNADLRHYLARLGRNSRCFSRCRDALRRAIKLFVWADNQRQLWLQWYPTYTKHVIDFVSP